VIGKQELTQAVWSDAFVTDDSLVQCTVELRRALGDRSQQLVKTVPKRGYLFAAPVIQCSSAPDCPPTKKRVNLPVPRTSLIGREHQVEQAAALLLRPDVRLLSFTGPGGAGKTRLAIAVAAAVADRFTAGLQFVGLAAITNPDLVMTALAQAFEVQQAASRTIPQLIGDRLKDSGLFLLLLDNFEQVLPAARVLVEVLEACPSLKVLVTSRECLHIYGEQEFPVTPLVRDAAIELFVQRAATVRPVFAITPENAAAIGEICSRLDGLPLAIELAAARTKMLAPDALLNRLQSRLQLLTGGALDLPERQQTLRNTIDWSYGLLNEAERKLFRRLSVFARGCTLEAAEAVCNTSRDLDIDLLDGLSSLVDKNLVQRTDRGGAEARFAMLETIREYALERLADSGEQTAVRRAHAAYCLVLAEEGNAELGAADRFRWLLQCDAEVHNFRFALDWLFQTPDADWGLRLCMALFRFWDMREHLTEGRARLEAVLLLAGAGYSKERARVSQFLGALATAQGDFPAAARFLEQSLSVYEELGDEWGIAASLNALAISARDRGDYCASQGYFERSLACWRLLPDSLAVARCLHNLASVVKARGDYARAQWTLREAAEIFEQLGDQSGAAWSINQQADVAREQGDLVAARSLCDRALSIFRKAGDRWGVARSLTDLGYIACQQGEHPAAQSAYRESLEIFAGLEHRRGIARALEGSACLALVRGDAARALKLAAAAAHLRRGVGAPLPHAEQEKLDRTLLPAWEWLSEPERNEAWAEGSAMSVEKAIQCSVEKAEPLLQGTGID
jgi:predicted ATPase